MEQLVRVLTFQAGFNSAVVLAGTTLLGVAAGVVGTFALLRKRALMGDALAHATLPGIALAFLMSVALGGAGKSLPVLLVGATVTGVLGVLAVQWIVRNSRLGEDVAIGAVLSTFFGVGIVLLSYIQTLKQGNQSGLSHFIFGQTAAMLPRDAMLIGAAALLSVLATWGLFKEFRLVCFDEQFAAVQGWPVARIDLAMMALVVLVTVIGLQAVGLILVIALLIIPAAAARMWTDRLGAMVVIAAVIGGLAGYVGTSVSALVDRAPAGSVIVLSAGAVFAVSILCAPRRGVLARVIGDARLAVRVDSQHVLRALYERGETMIGPRGETLTEAAVPIGEVVGSRDWSSWLRLSVVLRLLAWRGFVRYEGLSMVLTPRGAQAAARVTRNHRLWEEFMVRYAALAPSHVDRSADFVEHVLSEEIVRELEAALANGRRAGGAA